jgi:hypothetical protein
LFSALTYYLVEKKRRIVTFGASSIQSDSNKIGLHAFKTKVGFEALPVRRAFVLHPVLRPFASQLTLSAIKTALNFRPGDRHLRIAGGILACLLGEEAVCDRTEGDGPWV